MPLNRSVALSSLLGDVVGPETVVLFFVVLILLAGILWITWVVFCR